MCYNIGVDLLRHVIKSNRSFNLCPVSSTCPCVVPHWTPIPQKEKHTNTFCAPSLARGLPRGAASHIYVHPSIHFLPLIRVGSRGQQLEKGSPDLPFPGHIIQLFPGDPKAFPGQLRDRVSPACPGSSPGSPTGRTGPKHLTREASGGHPNQMPKPPHLAPLYAEEQRLYSEILPDGELLTLSLRESLRDKKHKKQ